MKELDRYLGQVSRHLVGLPSRVRRDVIQELRSHIQAQADAEGGDLGAVVERLGPPRETAQSYVQLYGYGVLPKVLALVLALLLSVLTLPFHLGLAAVLGSVPLANAALVALILLLVVVGLKLGSRVALVAGGGAAAVRLGGLGYGLASGASEVSNDPIALAAFVLTTALVAIAGWIVAPRGQLATP